MKLGEAVYKASKKITIMIKELVDLKKLNLRKDNVVDADFET